MVESDTAVRVVLALIVEEIGSSRKQRFITGLITAACVSEVACNFQAHKPLSGQSTYWL